MKDLRPGEIVVAADPVFVGRYVRSELSLVPDNLSVPSLAEEELACFGNVAILAFSGTQHQDNTIDSTWTLTVGGTVLVRGHRGFYVTDLERDKFGWFVRVKTKEGEKTVRVVLDTERDRWVVNEIP